jgi:hypothetical protein
MKFAVNRFPAFIFPAVTLPVTANEVNVPTLVMLGCDGVNSGPEIPDAVTVPDTAKEVSVPTLVIFG